MADGLKRDKKPNQLKALSKQLPAGTRKKRAKDAPAQPIVIEGWNIPGLQPGNGFPVYVVNQQATRPPLVNAGLPGNVSYLNISNGTIMWAVDGNGQAIALTFIPL